MSMTDEQVTTQSVETPTTTQTPTDTSTTAGPVYVAPEVDVDAPTKVDKNDHPMYDGDQIADTDENL